MINEYKIKWQTDSNTKIDLFFLNKVSVLLIRVYYIFGTADGINLWLYKRTSIGYLIGDYNVVLLVMESGFNITET